MPPDAGGPHPRLFFYVQHLLGIGHLHRAARIARALADDGFEVLVAVGGAPYVGADFGNAAVIQLPPVRTGPHGFSALVNLDGSRFDSGNAERRKSELLAAYARFAPDVLITEAFPFGRSQMRFELLPLLALAEGQSTPPLIASSIRDILQQNRRPKRIAETLDLVGRHYDLVLVHGDPRFARLESSFPEAGSFAAKLAYTGLVAPYPIPRRAGPGRYAAVVSAGGGAVGAALLDAALLARPLTRIADRPWLFLTGPNMPPDVTERLQSHRGPCVHVRSFVPDLAQTLADADISICQAGYNTVADVLAAGCRAIVVPYARDGETEQSQRAALLERRGLAARITEKDLSPAALAAAVEHAFSSPRSDGRPVDLDGARATARFLRQALSERAARAADVPR